MDNPSAILSAAATLIERYGHAPGVDALDRDGIAVWPHVVGARARGIAGALLVAGRDAPASAWLAALHAFSNAVAPHEYAPVRTWKTEDTPVLARELHERVWEWEDRPGRTTRHVLYAFRMAQELLVEERRAA